MISIAPITRVLTTGRFDQLSQKQRHTLLAFLFLSPGLIIWFLYRYFPLLWNTYLTFFDRSLLGEMEYVGMANYQRVLTDDVLLVSIYNTFLFFAAVPIAIVIALGLALLLNKNIPGKDIFRGIIFVPYVTMMVAVAVIWSYMFLTVDGVLNHILLSIGVIDNPIPWLATGNWARISVMLVFIWKTVGFYMIIILAGLQTIPEQVYEVSQIDGANSYQQFRYLTLPLLKPTLGICVLIGLVSSFELFDLVMVLTRGGPGRSTEILITWVYRQAFQFGNFGYAAVLTLLLFVLMVGVIGIGRIIQQKRW